MRMILATCAVSSLGLSVLAAAMAVEPAPSAVRPQAAGQTRQGALSAHKGALAAANKNGKRTVSVFVYDHQGKLVGPVDSPKLVLTPVQWRRRLTAEQYHVLRVKETEQPFCGDLVDNKKEGVYACAGCGLPLFSSSSKFDSGSGWPSFMQPVAKENIESHRDMSDGTPRMEVKCVRCKGHQGHVFDDGPLPTGLRFCLNSASLTFTAEDDLASLADPAAGDHADSEPDNTSDRKSDAKRSARVTNTSATANEKTDDASAGRSGSKPAERSAGKTQSTIKGKGMEETAVFAGGCFWCTEAAFQQLRGVSDVESGYSGGRQQTATYEQVSLGNTGHAEAIRVTYDPEKISYDQLLMVFFDAHDPTQLNRQGPDVGTQYRSAIFYSGDEQKHAVEAKIRELTEKKAYGTRRIVTKVEPLTAFYPAETYHQDFVLHNPLQPYVQGHSIPKACSVQKRHPELIDPEKAIKPVGN